MLGGQSKCGDGAHWGMECVWCQGALGDKERVGLACMRRLGEFGG